MFNELKQKHRDYILARNSIIRFSDEAIRKSKQAIFSLHRDQLIQAKQELEQVEDKLLISQSFFKHAQDLKYVGVYKAAMEEYLEAKLFEQALKTGKIAFVKTKTKPGFDDYLGALCDLSGELLRKIILSATVGKRDEAKKFKELVSQIIEELLQFDLTGYSRHKYDEAKNNLKKAEEIIYDLEIKRK